MQTLLLRAVVPSEQLHKAWLERGQLGAENCHLPPGIVKVNKEAIVPEFGKHLIMVAVHVSCKGGR